LASWPLGKYELLLFDDVLMLHERSLVECMWCTLCIFGVPPWRLWGDEQGLECGIPPVSPLPQQPQTPHSPRPADQSYGGAPHIYPWMRRMQYSQGKKNIVLFWWVFSKRKGKLFYTVFQDYNTESMSILNCCLFVWNIRSLPKSMLLTFWHCVYLWYCLHCLLYYHCNILFIAHIVYTVFYVNIVTFCVQCSPCL
jgi:hypothetical protein